MFIILSIYSKNSNSLTNFLKFFYKFKMNKTFKLKFYITQSQKKKKLSFFSVLQSPHVNKKSQEQFEYSLHCKQLKIHVSQLARFLTIWKSIKITLFSDIRAEIKCRLSDKPLTFCLSNKTDFDNFILKFLTKNVWYRRNKVKLNYLRKNLELAHCRKPKKNLSNKIVHTSLKLLDIYGEILIKGVCKKFG